MNSLISFRRPVAPALKLFGFSLILSATVFADSRVYVQFAPGAKVPVLTALAQAGGRVHYEFDQLNAVAVTLPDQALAGISRNPNVVLVEEDPIRLRSGQVTPYGVTMVEAPLTLAAGVTGAGITVGVIDSGVFADYKDTAGNVLRPGHADFAGLTMNGYPKGNPLTDQLAWNRDRDSHGTHVVGTIAAANNSLGVVGVAPGVTGIYMVKVFGDTGNWIYSSTLLSAVQNAVNAGSSIISMSLGGSVASTIERNGLQTIYNTGKVLLVAAAGNGGNTRTSYPAGYESVISVAAIDSTKALADFSQRNSDVELAAPGVGVLSTVSYRSASLSVGGTEYLASAFEYSEQASASGELVNGSRATTTGNGAWNGKVVLVERGDNSFAEKVQNVQAGGGVAAIIYNNVDGGFSGTLGAAGPTIPAISITRADGWDLLSKLGQSATVSTVYTIDAGGYDYFDGTSMATPHVSGVAALVWSKYPYPNATNAQVREALTTSALDLGVAGRDTSFGFGLVRANAALTKLAQIVSGGGGGDTTPPVISNVASKITNKHGTFEITWTTGEPATGSVVISPLKPAASSTLTTTHKFTFKGTKGVAYTYTISSTDAAGNTATDGPHTHQN